MKLIYLLLLAALLAGCKPPSNNNQQLKKRIDSLELKGANSYKPGFGEFMSAIQAHHAKLWFAGTSKNWKLADFELKEITESIEDIKQFETDRKETKTIGMIEPALDSVALAVSKNDEPLFEKHFKQLTNTCNSCHKANEFEFNVVKIPTVQAFSNQEFKPVQ
jgi:hypothetical protein